MRTRRSVTSLLLLSLLIVSATAGSQQPVPPTPVATYYREFVSIPGNGPALLYRSLDAKAPNSHIGILVMHPNASFLEHPTIVGAPIDTQRGAGLASTGYTVLAQNSTMSSNDLLDADKLLSEVSRSVKYLRGLPGVTKVVLLGHSGGGPTMAGYQLIAENGVAACQGKEKIVACPDTLAGMPPADGLILLDSSLGFGAITLTTLDAAVTDEARPTQLDSKLSLFNPSNGFHAPGGGTYSETFIQQYANGQALRMNKLIRTALERLANIDAGKGKYVNDEPFDVPGSDLGNPQVWSLDLNVGAHTHAAHTLVKPDGTRVNEVVHSLREPYKTAKPPALRTNGGYLTTVRRFLNTWAIRPLPDYGYGADYVQGIDYRSSYTSPVSAVEKIKAPLLVLGMSAGQLLVSAEIIFQHAASADRSLVFIEGATHGTTPIAEQYGNTTATTVHVIDDWLGPRF